MHCDRDGCGAEASRLLQGVLCSAAILGAGRTARKACAHARPRFPGLFIQAAGRWGFCTAPGLPQVKTPPRWLQPQMEALRAGDRVSAAGLQCEGLATSGPMPSPLYLIPAPTGGKGTGNTGPRHSHRLPHTPAEKAPAPLERGGVSKAQPLGKSIRKQGARVPGCEGFHIPKRQREDLGPGLCPEVPRCNRQGSRGWFCQMGQRLINIDKKPATPLNCLRACPVSALRIGGFW